MFQCLSRKESCQQRSKSKQIIVSTTKDICIDWRCSHPSAARTVIDGQNIKLEELSHILHNTMFESNADTVYRNSQPCLFCLRKVPCSQDDNVSSMFCPCLSAGINLCRSNMQWIRWFMSAAKQLEPYKNPCRIFCNKQWYNEAESILCDCSQPLHQQLHFPSGTLLKLPLA